VTVPEVLVHRDAELLAKAVAARLVTRLVDSVAARGTGSVVLTGGGIGTAVLAELGAAPARDAVDWRHLDIWWGDERFVPVGDPDALAGAITNVLEDRDAATAMGARLRDRVEHTFAPGRIAEQLEALYDAVTNGEVR